MSSRRFCILPSSLSDLLLIATLLLTSLTLLVSAVNYKPRTKLNFAPGQGYGNILVGIGDDIDDSRCAELVRELQGVISSASSSLHLASSRTAFFSSVKILLPRGKCLSVTSAMTATASDTYELSDFKITDSNPVSPNLPWTRQFRKCGLGGEDVFIPSSGFLLTSSLTSEEKGKLLFNEWTKFRYGVFDEFGYFGDNQIYPACYQRGEEMQMTSCFSGELPALSTTSSNTSAAFCEAVSRSRRDQLLQIIQRNEGSSSVMFMPQIPQVTRYCTNETHNRFARTKHNLLCNQRSVSDVLQGHPDFSTIQVESPPPVNFQVIRSPLTNDVHQPGYVFIIEDSPVMREQNRLRYIKQMVAGIVHLLPVRSMVGVYTSQGEVVTLKGFTQLTSDDQKVSVIGSLPDLDTVSLQERLNGSALLSHLMSKAVGKQNNVKIVLDNVLASLHGIQTHNWHLYLVTKSPSTSFLESRDALQGSDATLSVLTFEGPEVDRNWIIMYGTPNMRGVIPLPPTCEGSVCSNMVGLFLDDFMETMRGQHEPIYWHKIYSGSAPSGIISPLNISEVPPTTTASDSKFFITIVRPFTNQIGIIRPDGTACRAEAVHGYPYLALVTGCTLQIGTWNIDLRNLPVDEPPSHISIWTLSSLASPPSAELSISTYLGNSRSEEVNPNNAGVPVYVRVSHLQSPVLLASVSLNIYTQFGPVSGGNEEATMLRDDGIDPDITQDDGVYSGYLLSLSDTPTFHMGLVQISTSSNSSRAITSVQIPPSSQASILDDRMSSKCCGSFVPYSSLSTVGWSTFTSVLQGFRTSEGFNETTLPPERIGTISVSNDDVYMITISFTAPGARLGQGGGRVGYYESCCTYFTNNEGDVSSCHLLLCIPVDPGTTQVCEIRKELLYQNHVDPSNTEEKVFMTCSVRAVTSDGVQGIESVGSFDVEVPDPATVPPTSTSSCKYISDGCLPIVFFWILIGVIGLLIVLILLILICWCIYARRKRNKNVTRVEISRSGNNREQQDKDKANIRPYPIPNASGPGQGQGQARPISISSPIIPLDTSNNNSSPTPLYNVYVNKAFIQDTDGGLKLVAADGQLLPIQDDMLSIISDMDRRNNNENRNNIQNGRYHQSHNVNNSNYYPQPPSRTPLNNEGTNQNTVEVEVYRVPKPTVRTSLKNKSPDPLSTPERNSVTPSNLGLGPTERNSLTAGNLGPIYATVNRYRRPQPRFVPPSAPPSPSRLSTFSAPPDVPQRKESVLQDNHSRTSSPPRYRPPPPPPAPPFRLRSVSDPIDYDDDSDHWDNEDSPNDNNDNNVRNIRGIKAESFA